MQRVCARPRSGGRSLLRSMRRNYWLYLFLVPGTLFLIIFRYVPMGGIVIAFQNYRVVKGIMGSEWVGLANFRYLFESREFKTVFANSLTISLLRMAWGFPAPLLLSLMMNEMRAQGYKRLMQTLLYFPHFISWVVVVGMLNNLLSGSTGIVNAVIARMGGEAIPFLTTPRYFRTILISADVWKGAGWGTIIYMAAMAGIDPLLYEAAIIDGASRLARIRYVTLPGIASTVVVLLVLNASSILANGFEQIYLMQNALVRDVSEVLETYTYRIGLKEGRYSYATAVGLFQSVIGCGMLFVTNAVARRIGGGGLW